MDGVQEFGYCKVGAQILLYKRLIGLRIPAPIAEVDL